MKNFYVLPLIMLISQSIIAQTKLDNMLVNINKSSVTSGIIYERVTQFANLYNYNQPNYPNTADYNYLRQALGELHRASNQTRLISIQELENRIAPTSNASKVDIAILNSPFQILNYNEENQASGGLTLNTLTERFSQIPNKPPFYNLQTTIVAPTKSVLKGSHAVFKFNTNLYLTNGGNGIKTLTINFGSTTKTVIANGAFQTQTVTVPYTSSGTKDFTCNIIFNNNATLTTKGNFYFHYKSSSLPTTTNSNGLCTTSDPRTKDENVIAEESFKGYELDDPRIIPEIEYRIFYADASFHSDLKIYKPVIIIDGFDPGDKRKIQDCDCEEDPECASNSLSNGIFDPDKHRAMTDLMEYENVLGESSFILEQLRGQGYDVIMVNQPTYTTTNLDNGQPVTIDGGAYYIESNALALVALIKKIKLELAEVNSNEEIAIVGPSMGGQISRYALAYIEKKYANTNDEDWNHNTGLWVSVDSPHLGANIPIGDQSLLFMAGEIAGSEPAKDFYDNQLGSVAAKQQLIEFHKNPSQAVGPWGTYGSYQTNVSHLNGRVASQGYGSDDGSLYYKTYYNNQESNGLPNSHGYPQNLRKIALVNGSLTGKKTGYDSELVLNIRGFQEVDIDLPWPLGSINFDIHVASLESYFMPTAFSSNKKVSRFKAGFEDISHYSTNINSRGNMDTAPGGLFAAQKDIAHSVMGTTPINGGTGSFWGYPGANLTYWFSNVLGGSFFSLRDLRPEHSFIASFSAIAHKNPNQSWSNPLDYNLVCTDDTYFDSYFGHDQNTEHTSFTNTSANWLFEELAGNEQDPYYPVDPNSLNGDKIACASEQTVYSFENCKTPGDVAQWVVSPNISIIASDATSITIAPTADHRATGWIKAIFNNGISVRKDIWLGKPETPISISGPRKVPTGSIVNYLINITDGATSYKWSVPYAFSPVNNFNFSSNNWQMKPPLEYQVVAFTGQGKYPGYVSAKGQNKCGLGDPKSIYVRHSDNGVGILPPDFERQNNQDKEIVTLHPNPAQNKVTVSINDLDVNNDNIPSYISTITILDHKMKEINIHEFNGFLKTVEIDISYLNTGLNFLTVHTNKDVYTKKIIKK